MIRLLVVDDSGFMRVAIRKMLSADSRIQVVGEAANGAVAVRMARELRPQVITMDIDMPEMDGLAATRAIMAETPTPIIILSNFTPHNVEVTVKALELGAVDFISKSSAFVQLDIVHIENELRQKVEFWARTQLGGTERPGAAVLGARMGASTGSGPNLGAALPSGTAGAAGAPEAERGRRDRLLSEAAAEVARPRPTNFVRPPQEAVDLVVVGVSTGGPRMLPLMLEQMGRLSCPVVVAQHMPPLFTESLAGQLRIDTGLDVRESRRGQTLEPGVVTILRGGIDSVVQSQRSGSMIIGERHNPHGVIHPSADVLFRSAVLAARQPVAVILTGMGNDGTEGAKQFAQRELPVLVQSPESCVVGGMPAAAIDAGVASAVQSLEEIGRTLRKWAAADRAGPTTRT